MYNEKRALTRRPWGAEEKRDHDHDAPVRIHMLQAPALSAKKWLATASDHHRIHSNSLSATASKHYRVRRPLSTTIFESSW